MTIYLEDALLEQLADESKAQALDLGNLWIHEATPVGLDKIFNRIRALGLENKIHVLDLSNNQLRTLPEGLFQGLTALEWLDLWNNQLSTLPEGLFQGLTALEWLDLSGNQLSTLPEGLFQGLETLQRLYLSENQLIDLPAGIFNNLILDQDHPRLENNFQLTLDDDGKCQTLKNQFLLPDAQAIFDRLVKTYSSNIRFLEYALNNDMPWGVNFSDDQRKILNERLDLAKESEFVLFQYAKEQLNKYPEYKNLFEPKLLGSIRSFTKFR